MPLKPRRTYSLHKIGRLPGRGKRVTLINALPAAYGGIILADSQETVGDWKYSVLKIETQKVGQFQFVIAGGGHGDMIDAMIERFGRKLGASRVKTLLGFRDLLEKELKSTLRELHAIDKESDIHLIIAAQTGQEFEIWQSTTRTLIPIRRDRPTLLGYKSELYQHVANSLFSPGLRAGHLIAIGLHILELARHSCAYVDLPYSGAVVSRNGIVAFDKPLLKELTGSVTVFGAALNRLMLMCADTTVKKTDFQDALIEFQKTVVHLRRENLQKVAELQMLREHENGIGYGMSFLPEETMTTVTMAKNGEILVDIREGWGDVAEELAKRSKEIGDVPPTP